MKTHTIYTALIIALTILLINQCNRTGQHQQDQKELIQHLQSLAQEYTLLERKTDSIHHVAERQRQKVDSIRNAPPTIVTRWKERESEIAVLSDSDAFNTKDSVSISLGLRTPHTDSLLTALEAKYFVWLHEKGEVQDSVIQWQGATITELDFELDLQYALVGQYQHQVGNLISQSAVKSLQIEGLNQDVRRAKRQRWIYALGGIAVGALVVVVAD